MRSRSSTKSVEAARATEAVSREVEAAAIEAKAAAKAKAKGADVGAGAKYKHCSKYREAETSSHRDFVDRLKGECLTVQFATIQKPVIHYSAVMYNSFQWKVKCITFHHKTTKMTAVQHSKVQCQLRLF